MFQKEWGGGITAGTGANQWYLGGKDRLRKFAKDLRPLSIVKASQLALLEEYLELDSSHQVEKRSAVVQQLRALKKEVS
jgi:hypothetical protein